MSTRFQISDFQFCEFEKKKYIFKNTLFKVNTASLCVLRVECTHYYLAERA